MVRARLFANQQPGTVEVTSHSYFEGEADQNLKLPKAVLENELWNKIRIDPMGLPTGDIRVIPSLEYIRMGHKEIKAYEAHGELVEENGMMAYSLNYPKLERTLTIHFTSIYCSYLNSIICYFVCFRYF